MSDGRTEAIRMDRKYSYLDGIIIKKDSVFDEYFYLTDRLIKLCDQMDKYKDTLVGFWGHKMHDKKEFKRLKEELNSLKDRKKYLDTLINEFDKEYKDGTNKPLREFR